MTPRILIMEFNRSKRSALGDRVAQLGDATETSNTQDALHHLSMSPTPLVVFEGVGCDVRNALDLLRQIRELHPATAVFWPSNQAAEVAIATLHSIVGDL